MKDLDRMIEQAIDEEERDLLQRIGEEPGILDQALGLFVGRTGWMNALTLAVQTALFLAGAWAAWMFFLATDPVAQLRWGLPAVVLLLTSLIIKSMLWPSFLTARIIRELKLIQLQLVRTAARTDGEEDGPR
jgi:hypothetical protein